MVNVGSSFGVRIGTSARPFLTNAHYLRIGFIDYVCGAVLKQLFISLVLMVAVVVSASAQEICRVSDPTGTPLNIRETPNGQIVGNLTNGMVVSVLATVVSKDNKKWTHIGRDGIPIGWVFRDYVDCSHTIKNGPG